MDTISEKIDYIIKEIELTPQHNKFIKKAIKDKRSYYYKTRLKLKHVSAVAIINHNFQAETIKRGEYIEKLDFINNYLKKHIKGIEVHNYAPELNKLHFINNFKPIKIPQIISIEEAIETIAKKYYLSALKSYYYNKEYLPTLM